MEKNLDTYVVRNMIEKTLSELNMRFQLLKKEYPNPGKMDLKQYIWVVFASNSAYQSRDLLSLIDEHQKKDKKIKSSLHTILRGILEDFFYLRLLLVKEKLIDIHWDAFIYVNHDRNLNHFNALHSLFIKGKLIPQINEEHVTSEKGTLGKIAEYKTTMLELEEKTKNYSTEFNRLVKIFKQVDKVCMEYDNIMKINKVTEGTQAQSLEWLYTYIYKFQSGYTHQNPNMKEEAIECIWKNKGYDDDNLEITSLLQSMLHTILLMGKELKK